MSTATHLIRSRMKINVSNLAERPANVSFKDAVLEILGDLDGYMVHSDNVLVASYISPAKTAGGIILTDKSMEEDRWQGIIGLVLKMGPQAFKYDGPYKFEGVAPKVGDYVMFHTSDAREVGIKGQSCKIVRSELIRMTVPNPDELY